MRTGFRKKATAIFAAGAVALTAVCPMTVSAAYVDMERANWSTFADSYAEAWDQEMAAYQESGTSAGEVRLELGDIVRSMLSSILTTTDEEPMDFSWLESIGLRVAAAKEESDVIDAALGLCLNDVVLARLELPLDLGEDVVKFRVPELSESYLGAPLEFESEEAKQQWQRFKEVISPESVGELAPDGDTIAELLKRYGDILFDAVTDASSEEKTETLEGLEQTFTVEEGRLCAVDLAEVILEMTKQARDDEQLKELIENLGTFSSQENLYEEYQKAMDDTISDMEADMSKLAELELEDEENYISSKVWLDADGRCAGREFSLVADGEKRMQLAWLNVREGDQAALRMDIMSDDRTRDFGSGESVALSGIGTITDGKLNGEYTVTSSVSPQLNIEVSDYEADAEMGDFVGTYRLTCATEGTDDAQALFSLDDFALIFDVERRAQEKIDNVSLSLLWNDEPVAALHLADGVGEDLLSEDGGDDVLYDANDPEDMQKYISEITPGTIMENCRKAGVPDDFIAQVAGLITQMTQSGSAGSPEASETQESSGTSALSETEGI